MSNTLPPIVPRPGLAAQTVSHTPTQLNSRLAIISPDDRALTSLIARLIDTCGLHQAELANRMGVKRQSVNQYRIGRRTHPSVQWLARLVAACGGRLLIEFPKPGIEYGDNRSI